MLEPQRLWGSHGQGILLAKSFLQRIAYRLLDKFFSFVSLITIADVSSFAVIYTTYRPRYSFIDQG